LVNEQIRAETVRVIDSQGKQVGIMPLPEAIQKAKSLGFDLVEIASKATPPVVKIVDLGKFKYELEHKKKKSPSAKSYLKEVRFSPFIADHDLNIRILKIKEFLKQKNKVKISVVFTVRQMQRKEFGYQLIERILKELGEKIRIDSEPKFIGRNLITVISAKS